jgi:hypothetical protein
VALADNVVQGRWAHPSGERCSFCQLDVDGSVEEAHLTGGFAGAGSGGSASGRHDV